MNLEVDEFLGCNNPSTILSIEDTLESEAKFVDKDAVFAFRLRTGEWGLVWEYKLITSLGIFKVNSTIGREDALFILLRSVIRTGLKVDLSTPFLKSSSKNHF